MIEEDEISEVAFMDGFIEGYETAERDLSDEVERLRAALRKIRDYEPSFPVIYDGDDALAMKEIARAELGEEEGG